MAGLDTLAQPEFVVLVEDDAAVRTSLEFTFGLHGYEVISCPSAEDLLQRSLPAGRGCIVIDERLPGMGGLECLATLRADGSRLPAALITSNPPPQLRRAAAAAGVPIIEKPLLGEALSAWVRAALRG